MSLNLHSVIQIRSTITKLTAKKTQSHVKKKLYIFYKAKKGHKFKNIPAGKATVFFSKPEKNTRKGR